MSQYYKTAKISSIRDENYRVKTFFLDANIDALPGQFAMVWLPGFDEKPMCIVQAKPVAFSIAAVGPFSEKIHGLGQGDEMSFRGPLGNSFLLEQGVKKILMVGGGYGVAALSFLGQEAVEKKIQATMVIGARNEKDLLFQGGFAEKNIETFISTDDGSVGFKGRAHELVESLLAQGRKFDLVYACGPEKMMAAVAGVAKNAGIPAQLSLERYMGCGIGICGKCDAGGGLVCKQGPIFSAIEAVELVEFGKTHRDTSGRKRDW